jgi:small-conductance mechanosensitive channel
LDGIETVVPNDMLISGPVQNYSLSDRVLRLASKVSVSYDSDLEAVLKLLEQAVLSVERVSRELPPSAVLLGFGADGLDLEVGFWIVDPENGRTNVLSDVNRAIWHVLKANQVRIPAPQREVRVHADAATGLASPAAGDVPLQ